MKLSVLLLMLAGIVSRNVVVDAFAPPMRPAVTVCLSPFIHTTLSGWDIGSKTRKANPFTSSYLFQTVRQSFHVQPKSFPKTIPSSSTRISMTATVRRWRCMPFEKSITQLSMP